MDATSHINEKILTISIAAYNVEKTITRTLDSLTQGVEAEVISRLDIIVVNDGSKDATGDIVARYVERYPESVRIINKTNGGWGSTVNVSLAEARGKYYKLLDGDDWFCTENLEAYIEYLSHVDADIVLSPYIKHFSESEQVENCHLEIERNTVGLERLSSGENIYMHELTVRTEAFRNAENQISEHCFYTDNEYAFMVIKCAGTIQRFEKPIYVYQLGDVNQSVGINGIKKHYKDTVNVALRIYDSYMDFLNTAEVYLHEKTDGFNEALFKNKKILLEDKILLVTDALYVSYLLVNSAEARKELTAFDDKIKNSYQEIYKITDNNKKIKLLRGTGFLTYGVLAGQVMKRYV